MDWFNGSDQNLTCCNIYPIIHVQRGLSRVLTNTATSVYNGQAGVISSVFSICVHGTQYTMWSVHLPRASWSIPLLQPDECAHETKLDVIASAFEWLDLESGKLRNAPARSSGNVKDLALWSLNSNSESPSSHHRTIRAPSTILTPTSRR